ncbi:MAG: 3-deoxy-7-phosphoheptulonate synthase, partial [Muribaculaceae bacterium]|nr:3-deoxy-7-phosphoheptulonate synthase [Muribaculaceae bacterium]
MPAIEPLSARQPVIIAGPCSAESEEQVMETAEDLAKIGVAAFRAGVWKPRTHPGCFEGKGADALKWLAAAKRGTSLQTATEVASAQHLEEALDSGVDILWLGARTTTNPFPVQEIA